MDEGSLVKEQIDAGARFLVQFDKLYPIRAAFWLKDRESRMWDLYIVSDAISGENYDRVNREVVRLADEMEDPDFNVLRVTVLWPEKPLAQAALEARQRYRKSPRHLRNTYFGGVEAEEVYLYEQPVTVSASGKEL